MVVPGEAAPPPVDERSAFPPQRLRQQEAPLPRDVERGRVELDVLHAGQDGSRAQRHREAGALGARGVGRVRVQVAEPPSREDGGRRADGLQVVAAAAQTAATVHVGILRVNNHMHGRYL